MLMISGIYTQKKVILHLIAILKIIFMKKLIVIALLHMTRMKLKITFYSVSVLRDREISSFMEVLAGISEM